MRNNHNNINEVVRFVDGQVHMVQALRDLLVQQQQQQQQHTSLKAFLDTRRPWPRSD